MIAGDESSNSAIPAPTGPEFIEITVVPNVSGHLVESIDQQSDTKTVAASHEGTCHITTPKVLELKKELVQSADPPQLNSYTINISSKNRN